MLYYLLFSVFCSFKSNSTSILSTSIDEETGEERKRLINKMRWKGYGPVTISFADNVVRGIDQNMRYIQVL